MIANRDLLASRTVLLLLPRNGEPSKEEASMADRNRDQDRQRQQGGGTDRSRQQSQQGGANRQQQQGGQGQPGRQQSQHGDRDRQMGGGDFTDR